MLSPVLSRRLALQELGVASIKATNCAMPLPTKVRRIRVAIS